LAPKRTLGPSRSSPKCRGHRALRAPRRALRLSRHRRNRPRHAVALLQCDELVTGEMTPTTGREPFGGDSGKFDPGETHNGKPRRLAHPADLLVTTFADGELEPGLVALVPEKLRVSGK